MPDTRPTPEEGADPDLVDREVRSADPSLSPEANRLLTEELREAVGAERVRVPAATPDHSTESHGIHRRVVRLLVANRIAVIMVGGTLVGAGAVVALSTGSWWLLILALAIDFVGGALAIGAALQLSTEVEHVSPTTAARLEEEGMADPDATFSELVEDYAGASGASGSSDVVTPGGEERTASPEDDSARASAEQRSAMTPSSDASQSTDGTG